MRILFNKLCVVGVAAALCLVVSSLLEGCQGYRIASVNDIHGDLHYDPAHTGKCIQKDET